MTIKKTRLILVLLVLIIPISGIFGQDSTSGTIEKPRIAVKELIVNDTDNIQLKVISERVTDSTKLIMKFMNEYELADTASEYSDLSLLEESKKSFLDYCNKNNIDNIVYGKTYMGSDDSFVIEMSVFSREKEQTALTRIGRAETALDIFSAADSLTASIIEEFSGVHIAFGEIHLSNTGVEGSFIPYIDGEPFPADSYTIKNLLIGKRTVEIKQMRMLGESVILTKDVIVKENSVTDTVFEIPHLLPAEAEIIKDHDKIIKKGWNKSKWKQRTTRSFNKLDTLLSDTPYNLTLADLREEYKVKRAEYEANLVELGKKGKREIIVGASIGVNIGNVDKSSNSDNSKDDSPYDPIDTGDWNSENYFSPMVGVNLQYQVFNSFYLQTELNYKEIFISEYDSMDNYIRIIEIPVLFKLTKQFKNNRFSMYMGPAFYKLDKAGGIFDDNYSPPDFTNIHVRDNDIEMIMGLEYGFKKGRHLLTAGLRYSTMTALEYSFFDSDDNQDYDNRLNVSAAELILGYGYNLGGSGRIETEENRNKWIFPAEAGLMFMLSEHNSGNTEMFAGGGFLRKITKKLYAGIKGIAFTGGGAPMLSIAYTKDPDKIIHNYSFLAFPMMDTFVGAFQYNIAINRFSFGAFAGGPLENIQDIAVGFGAGYYF